MRSNSSLPKWRSEAHVQSVPQECRCMARGLGKPFTPAHIHSQLGSYTRQRAHSSRGALKEGARRMKLRGCCKVIQTKTHIRRSHKQSCSAATTGICPPGPCPAEWPWEQGLLQRLLYPYCLQNRPVCVCTTGSQQRDISFSSCRNKNRWKTWKLDHILPIFHVHGWQINKQPSIAQLS